jgi:uncharacterized protein YceK
MNHKIIVPFFLIALLSGCAGVDKAITEKDTGPRADSLAHSIMKASGYDAWQHSPIKSTCPPRIPLSSTNSMVHKKFCSLPFRCGILFIVEQRLNNPQTTIKH